MTLAERAASANAGETRALLTDLWWALCNTNPNVEASSEAWTFCKLRDLNTPESLLAAAMMLLPDGAGWNIHAPSSPDKYNLPAARIWGKWTGTFHGNAATTALALIAAVAQSKGL